MELGEASQEFLHALGIETKQIHFKKIVSIKMFLCVWAIITFMNLGESNFDSYRSWSPLTEEGYAEKLRLLREASSIPMERWRAPTVLAWLEVALGMPQYGARCAENVKSGKVTKL